MIHDEHPVESSDDRGSRNECGNMKRRRNETRQQWRVDGRANDEEERWREGKRQEEKWRRRERRRRIGCRVVNDNDGHRLSQRRRSLPPSRSDDDARRRVSPYCRDKYKAYFARSPIHPLATSSRRLCGWWLTLRDESTEIFNILSDGKNDFAERSKILAGYRKVILLYYQNNYAECSN